MASEVNDERPRARGSKNLPQASRERGKKQHRPSLETKANSLILIGMAGAGKSTVGRRLSKRYGKEFIDIDDVLVEQEGRSVAELAAELPFQEFVRCESRAASSVRARNAIIATGGSVVYCRRSMEHLRQLGTVVYLDKPFHETRRYSGDSKKRGIVMPPDQTLETYQKHRHKLYLFYADIVLWTKNAKIYETVGYLSGILEYIDPEHFKPLPNLVRYRPKPRKKKRGGRARRTNAGRHHSPGHGQGKEPRTEKRPKEPASRPHSRDVQRKGAPPAREESRNEEGPAPSTRTTHPHSAPPHPRRPNDRRRTPGAAVHRTGGRHPRENEGSRAGHAGHEA